VPSKPGMSGMSELSAMSEISGMRPPCLTGDDHRLVGLEEEVESNDCPAPCCIEEQCAFREMGNQGVLQRDSLDQSSW
jgi:hypothetical protein